MPNFIPLPLCRPIKRNKQVRNRSWRPSHLGISGGRVQLQENICQVKRIHLSLSSINTPGAAQRSILTLVPVGLSPLPGPSDELTKANAKRVSEGNALGNSYTDSWMKPADARSFALSRKADTARVMKLIAGSMGNYREISSFISRTPDSLLGLSLSLLESLSEKDLRDIRMGTLNDHLMNTAPVRNAAGKDTGLFNNMC